MLVPNRCVLDLTRKTIKEMQRNHAPIIDSCPLGALWKSCFAMVPQAWSPLEALDRAFLTSSPWATSPF